MPPGNREVEKAITEREVDRAIGEMGATVLSRQKIDDQGNVVEQQRRKDERVARRRRPRARPEPPDEPASQRTPSMNQVMHRAEALTAISPPVDAPPTPMNDTGMIEALTRMGGKVTTMMQSDDRERARREPFTVSLGAFGSPGADRDHEEREPFHLI